MNLELGLIATIVGKLVKDVRCHEFIRGYAAHLKKAGKIELPPWTDIVKTSVCKELPHNDPEWYYTRAASMVRKLYIRGGVGVGAFRKIYGGSKRNGTRPSHFCVSSGSIARHILKQLEKLGLVERDGKGGRKLTPYGRRDLDIVAGSVAG